MREVVVSLIIIFTVLTAIPKKSAATPLKPIIHEIVNNTINDLSGKQSTNQEATTTQEIADSTNPYRSGEQPNLNQPSYQQNPPPQQPYPNQPYYQQNSLPQQPYPNQPYYQQNPLPQQPYLSLPSYQQYPAPIYIMPMYPPQRPTNPVIINNF